MPGMAIMHSAENASSTQTKIERTSVANSSAERSSSPVAPSLRVYIGTKATLNAPSANSRRNVLGRVKASCHASAASPAPSARESSMSRTKPNTRLSIVKPPTVVMAFNRFMARWYAGIGAMTRL